MFLCRSGNADQKKSARVSTESQNLVDQPQLSGVGLTCLSVRCLSSYLIFSASSSDQQLRAKLARDMRREALHNSAPLISPLVCQYDLDEQA